jgi:hypothetical protein
LHCGTATETPFRRGLLLRKLISLSAWEDVAVRLPTILWTALSRADE